VAASAVLAAVVGLVERLVTFPVVGAWSKADVAALFVYAGARRTSLTQACDDLVGAMSDSRLRQLWARFQAHVVQRILNALLLVHAVRLLSGRALRLAIDLTEIPYHGRPHRNPNEVRRGKGKAGTSHFHAYATAYVILAGRRFTLAVKYVRKGETLDGVLGFLLTRVQEARFRILSLDVDRGFCNVACIRYLQGLSFEVLMPLVIRGAKGERVLAPRKSGRTTYTMNSPTDGAVTFPVVLAVVYAKGRRGQHRANKYAYVALRCAASPRTVYQRYRMRFGIEASYRLMHRARARTSTQNPAIRLVLFGVSLLMENEWVATKYERLYTMRRGRGGRIVHDLRLKFERFLAWIVHAAHEVHGFVTELVATPGSRTRKRHAATPSGGGGKY
jgi:putative transposase